MNTLRPRKRIGQKRRPYGPGRLDLLPCPAKRMHERGGALLLMPWPVQVMVVTAAECAVKAALARMTDAEFLQMTQGRPLPPEPDDAPTDWLEKAEQYIERHGRADLDNVRRINEKIRSPLLRESGGGS